MGAGRARRQDLQHDWLSEYGESRVSRGPVDDALLWRRRAGEAGRGATRYRARLRVIRRGPAERSAAARALRAGLDSSGGAAKDGDRLRVSPDAPQAGASNEADSPTAPDSVAPPPRSARAQARRHQGRPAHRPRAAAST